MDYKRLINVFCLSLVRCEIIYEKPLPVKDLKPAKKWVNNPTKPNLIALTMAQYCLLLDVLIPSISAKP